ncbi:MAG TPA: hypothetical protein VJ901_07300 [Thermoanaerobaculia bacterium]|nr:hypothetical protein [Thermoanaerobaculia bacterium]
MRFLMILAGALLAIWLVITATARLAVREALSKPWPAELGTLHTVPRRYPSHPTTTAARNLAELVSPAGIQLGMKGEEVALVPMSKELNNQFTDYLYAQLQRSDDSVTAPPTEIAATLRAHQQLLADVTRYVNESGSSIDWHDEIEAENRSYPPLEGIQRLSRLLAANALLKRDASSWDDLHAIVLLVRPLWHREDTYCVARAISSARLANGVARKLPPPVPPWWREVGDIDARHAVLAAYQGESWLWWKWSENWRRRMFVRSIVLSAAFDAPLASFLNQRRGAAEAIAGSHDCAFDVDAWNKRWKGGRWNFMFESSRDSANGAGTDFQRAAVFDFERSAAERVMAIKEHRPLPAASRCSDGTWTYANNVLQFSKPIPIESPGRTAVPVRMRY